MREFNALASYPRGGIRKGITRTINDRITASARGAEFFDGARSSGYGGYVDDGRWGPVAADMFNAYGLDEKIRLAGHDRSISALQVNCEKGFLLGEFEKLGIKVYGTETSRYAIKAASVIVDEAPPTLLPYPDESFDLVIGLGSVYSLNLAGAIESLQEIERVKRKGGASFVTLAAYKVNEDLCALRDWSLLGCTILREWEWMQVLGHCRYTGDYSFVTAETLGLL